MTIDLQMLWNGILTLILIPLAWILVFLNTRITKAEEKSQETFDRVWKSISEHREDIPKTYVTKTDLLNTHNQIMSRFDRLEEKIDRITGVGK